MLVLSGGEVEALLDRGRLVEAVASAMAELSAGRASMPARVGAVVEERNGLLGAMPAYLPSCRMLAAKLVTVFPGNRHLPTHHAVICCFDPATGAPVAVMDGAAITAARTAAGSVVATRFLARDDARVAAVVGTGVQARAHVLAMAGACRLDVIRVAGRHPDRAATLVAGLAGLAGEAEVPVEAAPSIEVAVREADIVCATTHAARPVVRREWLRPGTHVNSVGYNTAGSGEIDAETVRDALVVVESRAVALAPPPAGAVEFHHALGRGLVGPDHVRIEVGELVLGLAHGREDAGQLTLYKSVGVAVQDAAAAAMVLDAARQQGRGRQVEL